MYHVDSAMNRQQYITINITTWMELYFSTSVINCYIKIYTFLLLLVVLINIFDDLIWSKASVYQFLLSLTNTRYGANIFTKRCRALPLRDWPIWSRINNFAFSEVFDNRFNDLTAATGWKLWNSMLKHDNCFHNVPPSGTSDWQAGKKLDHTSREVGRHHHLKGSAQKPYGLYMWAIPAPWHSTDGAARPSQTPWTSHRTTAIHYRSTGTNAGQTGTRDMTLSWDSLVPQLRRFGRRPGRRLYSRLWALGVSGPTTPPISGRCSLSSVISVQQFIFILVFIQFSVNHFYFYSTFIHFSSYLVQAFTIILVLIRFSFLINQIYEMYCYIQLKILLFSFRKTRISKFFFSRFRLPAVSIPQRETMRSHMLLMLVPTTSPTPVAQDCGT